MTTSSVAELPDVHLVRPRAVGGSPGPAPEPARIVILARDEIVRRGLVHLLSAERSLRVVGLSGDIAAVDDRLADRVDLVLLDAGSLARTPAALDAVRSIKRSRPDVGLVLFAAELSDAEVLDAVCAGVDAVASRAASATELLRVFRQVAEGVPALDRHYTAGLVRALRTQGEACGAGLTSREREVVALVAAGHRNAEIARTLFISESTVKFHLRNLMSKLGVTSRTEVIATAIRMGLG